MKKERIHTYNALKGIGALGILFSHMSYLSESTHPFWKSLYDVFMSNGSAFATLFMILSGFFLQYTWKNTSFKTYFIGKLKRVYPLTFCVFAVALIVDIFLSSGDVTGKGVSVGSSLWLFNIVANVFLFKAFIPDERTFFSFHGPSWYISVLVCLYMFSFPLLRGLNGSDKSKYLKLIKTICIATYSVQLIACTLVNTFELNPLWPCYVSPWFRIFGEGFLGILICEFSDLLSTTLDRFDANRMEWLSVCLIVSFLLIRNMPGLYCYFAATLQTIPMATTIIVFRHGLGSISSALKKNSFQFLGNISFELYMTHAFVYEGLPIIIGLVSRICRQWLISHAGTRFVITLILSIIVAWVTNLCMRKVVYKRLIN